MQQHRVRAIGPVLVTTDGTDVDLRPGHRQLLSLLVAAGRQGASTDRLADEVWGEKLPPNWRNSLRVAVSRLRRRTSLPIVSIGGHYRLDLRPEDVDIWHLWDAVESDRGWHGDLGYLLDHVDPFRSVEPSRSILDATRRVTSAQHELIEWMAAIDDQLPRPLLERIEAHFDVEATDEGLAAATAVTLARCGASEAALAVIGRCRQQRRDQLGSGIGDRLENLASSLTMGDTADESTSGDPASSDPAGPDSASPEPAADDRDRAIGARSIPLQLERHRNPNLVGRSEVLEELVARACDDQPGVTVLNGPAGIGKTALLAELAHRVAPSVEILYLPTTAVSRSGLAPIATAVPGFGAYVESLEPASLDATQWMVSVANRLVELLAVMAGGKQTLVVIDDAQWLDSQTCEILDYLFRSELGLGIRGFVLACRPGNETSPWSELEQSLDRGAGITYLTLPPLTVDDVAAILAAREPETSLAERHHKARWLHHTSGGRPEVAHRILDLGLSGMDEPTDGQSTGNQTSETEVIRSLDRLVAQLDEPTRALGTTAAIIGRRFRISDLAAMTGRHEDDIYQTVDRLVDDGLVTDIGSIDHYEFAHQLLVDALLRAASSGRRAHLHRRASELTDDVHAKARHLLGARALVDHCEVLQAVLQSAAAYLDNAQFWESAGAYRTAISIGDGDIPVEDWVGYATAVSRSGARRAAAAVRGRAFAAAAEAKEWDLAVKAACSGLPEAELVDGEVDRFQLLVQVPEEGLSQPTRFLRARLAGRIASQLGWRDEAATWTDRAMELADSPAQTVEAALALHMTQQVDRRPELRLRQMNRTVEGLQVDETLESRIVQYRFVDLMESGRLAEAEVEHRRFAEMAKEPGSLIQQWHAQITGSMLAETAGRLSDADRLRDEAQRFGRRIGVAQADIVHLAQTFFRLETIGQLSSLVGMVDAIPVPDTQSKLYVAATTKLLILDDSMVERGVERAAELAVELVDRPNVVSSECLGLLAPALALHPDVDLRRRVIAALEPLRGGGLIIGIGLGLLPSVEYLCLLLDDSTPAGREQALAAAIADCDRSGFLSWSIRYRLDLAELTGSDLLRQQAAELAQETELAAVTIR
jgi:DNA-binding SARP family transcriptional activator